MNHFFDDALVDELLLELEQDEEFAQDIARIMTGWQALGRNEE